jgi:hypothetical protein
MQVWQSKLFASLFLCLYPESLRILQELHPESLHIQRYLYPENLQILGEGIIFAVVNN